MKKIISLVLALCLSMPVFAAVFNDLTGYDWAENAISEMAGKGIINGIGNEQFDPEGNVTYEQLAKMVVLSFNLNMTLPSEPTYTDVDEGRWSYPYIEAAKQLYEIGGDKFSPESYMTRYEVVKVITSAVINGNTEGFINVEFTDQNSMTEDMKKWASIATNLGIVQGYPDVTFRPTQKVSRAETAVMLSRAMNCVLVGTTPEITATPTATPTPTPTPEATPIPVVTPTPEVTPTPTVELKTRMDFFVVTNVVKVSVDGGETTKVTGFDDGVEVTFTCERAKVTNATGAVTDSAIAVGDVISAVRDINGTVRNISILFSVSDKYQDKNVINPYEDGNVKRWSSGSMEFFYGLVRVHNGNTMLTVFDNKITAQNETNTAMCALGTETNVYKYNPDTKKVKLADTTDIIQDKTPSDKPYSEMGTYVFVRAVDYLAKDVFIISNKR